jgi:hypothetical protein
MFAEPVVAVAMSDVATIVIAKNFIMASYLRDLNGQASLEFLLLQRVGPGDEVEGVRRHGRPRAR